MYEETVGGNTNEMAPVSSHRSETQIAENSEPLEFPNFPRKLSHPFEEFTDFCRSSTDTLQSFPPDSPSVSLTDSESSPLGDKLREIPSYDPKNAPDYPKNTVICHVDIRIWFAISTIIVLMLNVFLYLRIKQFSDLVILPLPLAYNLLLILVVFWKNIRILKILKAVAWTIFSASILIVLIFPAYLNHHRGYHYYYVKFRGQTSHIPDAYEWDYTWKEAIRAAFEGFIICIPCIGMSCLFASQLYLISKMIEVQKFEEKHREINRIQP